MTYIVVNENEIVKAEMERPEFSAWEMISPAVDKVGIINGFVDHCLSLPRIPAPGHKWELWQTVEEGKDFEWKYQVETISNDVDVWRTCTLYEYNIAASKYRRIIAIPIQPTPECNHEPLVDTGIGYYHCPACKQGWTYEEWRSKQPTPEGEKVFGEWQLCPKCNGDGNLARYNSPSIISTDASLRCDVCNGAKILARPLLTNDNTQTP